MSRISIRVRSAIIAALVGGVAATGLGLVTQARAADEARHDFDVALTEETAEILLQVSIGHPIDSFLEVHPQLADLYRVAVVDAGGAVTAATAARPPWPPGGYPLRELITVDGVHGEPDMRLLAAPIGGTSGGSVLVVAETLAPLQRVLTEDLQRTLALIAFAIFVTGLGGYLLAWWVLRPIESLRAGANALAEAPEGRRLPVPASGDEVERLARTLNTALDRIEEGVRRQRRFVAEASHELRAPLARMRLDVDLARRPHRDADELDASLEAIDRHAGELSALADSLLGLVGAQQSGGMRVPCSVSSLLASVRRRLPEHACLEFVVADDVASRHVRCDVSQLAGAIANLVENAFVHGAPPVAVRAVRHGVEVEVSVEDSGPGFPAGEASAFFQPFVRGADALDRDGAGLGLAIASEVVDRHGGTLDVDRGAPGGRVVVCLPLVAVAAPQRAAAPPATVD